MIFAKSKLVAMTASDIGPEDEQAKSLRKQKYCKAQASDIGPEDRQTQPLRRTGVGLYSPSVTCQVVSGHFGRDFAKSKLVAMAASAEMRHTWKHHGLRFILDLRLYMRNWVLAHLLQPFVVSTL